MGIIKPKKSKKLLYPVYPSNTDDYESEEKRDCMADRTPVSNSVSTEGNKMTSTNIYSPKNKRNSTGPVSAIQQCCNRFTVLWGHVGTTYGNSKLILGMLRRSKTVHEKTKSYLLKMFIFRIVLLVTTVGLNIGLSYPQRWYSTALNERNEEQFWHYLKLFVLIVCFTAPIYALDEYIHDLLSMRFRQTLTNMLFDLYMTKRAYYHLRWKTEIDNPGQRFGDDIRSFAYGVFDLCNVILKHILNLLGFSYVLYSIDVTAVPMLMIYSMCGTIFALTVFSRKLTELGYILMKDKAEFRTNIIRIHDSSESIALYNAAKHERNWLQMRLETLISDGITNCKWSAGLSLFTQIFHFLSIVVPYVLLAQKYFEKKIEFGELSQSIYAFSALLRAMNIITNNIGTLTSLASTSTRVGTAISAVQEIHITHQNKADPTLYSPDAAHSERAGLLNGSNDIGHSRNMSQKIETIETNGTILKLENMSYYAPKSDHLLLKAVNLTLMDDESLLIVGFSGCGKSSLLRVISGLWNDGHGQVTRPKLKNCLFLPQKPYIPNLPLESNTLRNQLLFPKYLNDETVVIGGGGRVSIASTNFQDALTTDDVSIESSSESMTASSVSDQRILDVLKKINLTHLDTYSSINQQNSSESLIYCKADWCNCLSVGEQQRLAIGRCIISKPNMIFVDEATSALDSVNEKLMYEKLKEMNVPLISVGHHKDLARFHDYVLEFQKDGKWKLYSRDEFMAN